MRPLFSDSERRRTDGPESVVLEQSKAARAESPAFCDGTGEPDRVRRYEETFLCLSGNTGRRQTYISNGLYERLSRVLPLLGEGMTVPAFLDNVLSHHLATYGKEMEEIFRQKLGEVHF